MTRTRIKLSSIKGINNNESATSAVVRLVVNIDRTHFQPGNNSTLI